jgi:hypothetical protein
METSHPNNIWQGSPAFHRRQTMKKKNKKVNGRNNNENNSHTRNKKNKNKYSNIELQINQLRKDVNELREDVNMMILGVSGSFSDNPGFNGITWYLRDLRGIRQDTLMDKMREIKKKLQANGVL